MRKRSQLMALGIITQGALIGSDYAGSDDGKNEWSIEDVGNPPRLSNILSTTCTTRPPFMGDL